MGRGRKRRTACVAAAALACLVVPLSGPGQASPQGPQQIVVRKPAPDALQEAIDAAAPGATIRVRKGRYREALLVEKPIKLVAVGRGRPTIDGLCQFPSAISVASAGVVLKGLRIQGAGAFAAVDFSGVADGRAHDLRLRNTCDTEYGINVVASGAVRVTNNRAMGFTDAGIYVGEITGTPTGPLFVGDNDTSGNNKGVIVEFSAGGNVVIFSNEIHANNIAGIGEQVGLFVFDSDGVQIVANRIRGNGSAGLVLTPSSDNNAINGNEITGNPTDVRNEGVGNCGSGNTFATGGPLSAC